MKKEVTLGMIQAMYIGLFQNWNEIKNQIQLDPKNLYSLIGIKKVVLTEMEKMQEAVQEFISTIDNIEYHDDGSFSVPDEHIQEVNNKLAELNASTILFDYVPIEIKDDNCQIPMEVMETLFDFIEIK